MAQSLAPLSRLPDQGHLLREALRDPSVVGEFLAVEEDAVIYHWGRKLHHAVLPVAVAAGAWIDPGLARQVYGTTKLPDMLARVPAMDIHERRAIAALGGVSSNGYGSTAIFDAAVIRQAERYSDAFTISPGLPPTRYAVRPRDLRRKQWNRMPFLDQVMVATLIGLYSGDGGRHLMPGLRLPGAVDAVVAVLDGPDALRADFFSLLAFYPDW